MPRRPFRFMYYILMVCTLFICIPLTPVLANEPISVQFVGNADSEISTFEQAVNSGNYTLTANISNQSANTVTYNNLNLYVASYNSQNKLLRVLTTKIDGNTVVNSGQMYSIEMPVNISSLYFPSNKGGCKIRYFLWEGSQQSLKEQTLSSTLPTPPSTEDITPPYWQANSNISFNYISDHALSISWPEANDNLGVVGYNVYVDDNYVENSPTERSWVVYFESFEPYEISVRAYDLAGNLSSQALKLTRSANDSVSPQWTDGQVTATEVKTRSATLTWTGASDNRGIKEYKVYNGETLLSTVSTNTYTLNGLTPSTEYTVTIKALDDSNNVSLSNPSVTFTTASNNLFEQGTGYYSEEYDQTAQHPTNVNWSGRSRYVGSSDSGIIWRYPVGNGSSPVVANDGTVYVDDSANGKIIALNADGSLKWEYTTNRGLESSIVIAKDGTIYTSTVINGNRTICALNSDGTKKWETEIVNSSSLSYYAVKNILIGSNGNIYFSIASDVYCYTSSGAYLWQWSSSSTISQIVLSADKKILVATGTLLYALNESGVSQWFTYLNSVILADDGIIYGVDYNYLKAFNPTNKQTLWSTDIGYGAYSSALDNDGNIILSFNDKWLIVNRNGAIIHQSTDAIYGRSVVDAEGKIYTSNGMYTKDGDGYSKQWSMPVSPFMTPILMSNGTILAILDGYLYALGTPSGSQISFSTSSFNGTENSGMIDVTISRTGNTSSKSYVNMSVVNGGTATGDIYSWFGTILGDYTPVNNQTIVFNAGETQKTVSLTVRDDSLAEGNEFFNIELSNPIGSTLSSQNTAVCNIIDDEPRNDIFVEQATYSVNEDVGNAIVKIKRAVSGTNIPQTSVKYQTNNGTATAGTNYTAASGTITFNANELEKIVSIPITNNSVYSGNLNFNLIIKDPTNGSSIPSDGAMAVVTIVDDEPMGEVFFAHTSYSVNENDGTVSVIVNRTVTDHTATVMVDLHVNTTATSNEDYEKFPNQIVSFGVGQSTKTFTIYLIDDTAIESLEYISLQLTNPTNVGLATSSIITEIAITDNDSSVAPPTIAVQDDNTQFPVITVTGIYPGDKLILYKLNTATQAKEKKSEQQSVGGNSWSFSSINSYGTGTYYVTRTLNNIESDYSIPLLVTVSTPPPIVYVPSLSQTISIDKGTNAGTIKLTITGQNPSMHYFYGVDQWTQRQGVVQENINFGMESYFAPNIISNNVTDNITASKGFFINIYEVSGSGGYGDVITAVSTISITSEMIK